eukprot:snap_masked-scaffold_3-processed-gene-15.62-mRNA-1 protein AED:1.00 eAED:1.00 QI:0/0/0/0/1/1/2/0/60
MKNINLISTKNELFYMNCVLKGSQRWSESLEKRAMRGVFTKMRHPLKTETRLFLAVCTYR